MTDAPRACEACGGTGEIRVEVPDVRTVYGRLFRLRGGYRTIRLACICQFEREPEKEEDDRKE